MRALALALLLVAAGPRFEDLEQAIAADPENLAIAAEYRQQAIAAGAFDRSIDFFEKLAKRKGSGPNVQMSLALAYVDKVPVAGDMRRLYLGRDAINALTKSLAQRPTATGYYVRGLIDLYYNRFMFNRTDKGVADLEHALAIVPADASPILVRRIYTALGDGYFRLDQLAKARSTWTAGLEKFPDDAALQERLAKSGEALADVVTTALTASHRVDTSLSGVLPIR